jgi:hypothetical protein
MTSLVFDSGLPRWNQLFFFEAISRKFLRIPILVRIAGTNKLPSLGWWGVAK